MLDLKELQSSKNIVDLLIQSSDGKLKLAEIGSAVVKGYKIDEDSRQEWKDIIDRAMSIAKQVSEPKNTPWPGASNVKFPLITDASIDYASRTLPEIIQNERVVQVSTVGLDPNSDKFKRGERVAKYMSYQLIMDSPDWEDGVDKLLQILPVLGTVFKKTYYSVMEKRNISELCVPDKIIVNYNCQSLESARRITHLLTMYSNDIIERQRKGLFCDEINVDELCPASGEDNDDDYPLNIIEQHCWIDLDGDGYKEPYVVTVHLESQHVLRIVNRFKKIYKNQKGQVYNIEPVQYFTDFHFIRSPDGGFYSQGFGSLLLPINSAINTLINQLIDSGTLANTQGGFLGRGLRIKNGEFKMKMGEWKVLDTASGVDIGQNVYPLPVREPSQTLFSLLGLLIQVGKDMSSTTDVLSGKQPAQNVAAGTINQLVEQGTKVFTAINKRLYRSLKKEYTKLYELNCEHISNDHYKMVLDDPLADGKKDFELNTLDVHPVADPTISSANQRIIRAQLVQQLRTGDPRAMDVYMLEALQMEESQIQQLLPPPPENPPPPPENVKLISEANLNDAKARQIVLETNMQLQSSQLSQVELEMKAKESDARVQESMARVWKMQKDAAHGDAKIAIAGGKMQQTETLKQFDMIHKHKMDDENLQLEAISEANKKIKSDNEAKLKAAEIGAKVSLNKEKINKDSKENKGPRTVSTEDLVYTSRLKGLSVAEVMKKLEEDSDAD